MKRITLVGATLILAMTVGSAAAQVRAPAAAASLTETGTNKGAIGINGSISNGNSSLILAKYFLSKEWALKAGLAALKTDDGAGTSNSSSTFFGGVIGVNKYWSRGVYAPFIGIQTGRVRGNDTNTTAILTNFEVQGGLEYFMHRNFSLQGQVGFGIETREVTGASRQTVFGTSGLNVSANIYF